jgi:tRNA-2-methylthio-N6-dimethylallyladenosine synthase
MPDDVPAEVKSERLHRVEALEARISEELNRAYVGSLQEILVEGARNGQPFGRTRTGKLAHLDAPARTGDLVRVQIEHAGPFSLRGTPVDALALV